MGRVPAAQAVQIEHCASPACEYFAVGQSTQVPAASAVHNVLGVCMAGQVGQGAQLAEPDVLVFTRGHATTIRRKNAPGTSEQYCRWDAPHNSS